MADILAVGIATLDVIHHLDSYPEEDSEQRALSQVVCRGGNATNTLTVLSQLGHQCHWAGVLADDFAATLISRELQRYAIHTEHCERLKGAASPLSLIHLCDEHTSRTITHYRDLPEYSLTAFQKIDLTPYDWLHMEGRDVAAVHSMLQHARSECPQLRISLELEKPRDSIESLIPFADVVLCAGDYARFHGDSSSEACVRRLHARYPGIEFTCTWGSGSASAMQPDGNLQRVEAIPPDRVVDTRAAGDVFNAAYIDASLKAHTAQQRLQAAMALATHKCTQSGIDTLVRK